MNLGDYIKQEAQRQIDELAKMEGKLSGKAIELQGELFALIRDKFLDTLQKDAQGNILYNSSNITRVNDMIATWDYFREQVFRPEVLNFGKDLLSIVDLEAAYFLKLGERYSIPFEFKAVTELISKQIGITLSKEPQIIAGSYLDRLLTGTQIRDNVTNIILESISAKTPFVKLKADLEAAIKGSEEVNGQMEKYLRTYAYDTISHVQRAIDKAISDAYGLECFVYEGNIIKDSRDFCVDHLGETMCEEEIAMYESEDWAGKDPDTPFEISLGGYNCRHTAMWIPKEAKLNENITND